MTDWPCGIFSHRGELAHHTEQEANDCLLVRNSELLAQNHNLIQALKQYADHNNWQREFIGFMHLSDDYLLFQRSQARFGWEIAEQALNEEA